MFFGFFRPNYAACACGHDHAHSAEGLKPVDKFRMLHPDTEWEAGLEYGEQLGLGTRRYELIKL